MAPVSLKVCRCQNHCGIVLSDFGGFCFVYVLADFLRVGEFVSFFEDFLGLVSSMLVAQAFPNQEI